MNPPAKNRLPNACLNCRALRDIQAARVNNARTRTAIQIEDALEFGQTVRRNCVHLGAALLQARRNRLLKFVSDFWGPQVDSGLPVDSVFLVEASKPYKELRNFTNTIEMQPRKEVQQELSELATEPDHWFAKLKALSEPSPILISGACISGSIRIGNE